MICDWADRQTHRHADHNIGGDVVTMTTMDTLAAYVIGHLGSSSCQRDRSNIQPSPGKKSVRYSSSALTTEITFTTRQDKTMSTIASSICKLLLNIDRLTCHLVTSFAWNQRCSPRDHGLGLETARYRNIAVSALALVVLVSENSSRSFHEMINNLLACVHRKNCSPLCAS